MKTILLNAILLLLLNNLIMGRSYSYKGEDSLHCLEISGKVDARGNSMNNTYKVELIKGNIVIDSVEIKDRKAFKFKLEKNEYYGIRVSKKGFVSRLISVCTDLESKKYEHKFYRFHFDTKLINNEKSVTLNKDALDFPIAVISFNNKRGWFYYSKRYTAYIKRKIYTVDLAVNKVSQ